MASSAPPPTLRDDNLDLVTLGRMAREFDQISEGRAWPATDFVQWLADEWRASTAEVSRCRDKQDGEAA